MTSSSAMNIFWIDDDENRKKDAEHLEKTLEEKTPKENTSLKVTFLTPKQWTEFLEGSRSRENLVDLFLLDYLLFIKGLHSAGGLSVAGEIRENFPNVPIYMFSVKAIPEVAEGFADSILDLKEIQRNPVAIYYDTMDYRRIRASPSKSASNLLDLLKAPELDGDRIFLALPESIKKTLLPTSSIAFNPLDFAKWIKCTFLKLPGFVYSSLYSATKLGMTKETFLELSSEFEGARYFGVFAQTNPRLWWASRLRDIVFQIAHQKLPDDDTTDLTRLAPRLFGLNESKASKCAVCWKRYPETVGSSVDQGMQPVHYRCSIPHPEKTRVLYFEEERQFSKEG